MTEPKIIASMTSYPARMNTITGVIETILNQTKRPDEIVLWLAENQFPGKESDLPADVLALTNDSKLKIRWCEDLRSHKKYYYSLTQFPDDIIITFDDDLYYPDYVIEKLMESYIKYPDCVHTARAHLMVFDEMGEILPYSNWVMETDALIGEPCMQLMATGGAGTLYPPSFKPDGFLAPELFMNMCPLADDLWMKTMEIGMGVPVVLAMPCIKLNTAPGSQENALYLENQLRGKNDEQLANIIKWYDGKHGRGDFFRSVCTGGPEYGTVLQTDIKSIAKNYISSGKRQTDTYRYMFYDANDKYQEILKSFKKLQTDYKRLQTDYEILKERSSAEISELKGSNSYKIGRKITWPVRKIKELLSK